MITTLFRLHSSPDLDSLNSNIYCQNTASVTLSYKLTRMKIQIGAILLVLVLCVIPCYASSKVVARNDSTKQAVDDKAIAIVCQRKEIKQWIRELNAARKTNRNAGKAAFDVVDHKGNVYTVHVFENRADHTATFNWYEVDIKTGKVNAQF